MSLRKKTILISLAAAIFFSLLYLGSFFQMAESRIYDAFLRYRPARERSEEIVFLDVDDQAIAYIGVFPWPRSVVAEALLRLKEFGAGMAIFDIEYIDQSPAGINDVYRQWGLDADFYRAFGDIWNNTAEMINAMAEGRFSLEDIYEVGDMLGENIDENFNYLYKKVQDLYLDNDLFLSQAAALYGRVWATLNLRDDPLSGDEAQRRPYAEEHFSYPLLADPKAPTGDYADILPALPSFAEASKGAGFTNVTIDEDGVRRRLYLARKVGDYWYLQLAFAPLMDYLGSPEISLRPGLMEIRGALMPDGSRKDMDIPLDSRGAMLLDWPTTSYDDSFEHQSFATFSLLTHYENSLKVYLNEIANSGVWTWKLENDAFLVETYNLLNYGLQLADYMEQEKQTALAENSEEAFAAFLEAQQELYLLIEAYLDSGAPARISEIAKARADLQPGADDILMEETAFVIGKTGDLQETFSSLLETRRTIETSVKDKFCILGRVDTGTTDIGVNPFFGEYVNVGTHAIVLDSILAGSFIRPLSSWWSVALTLLAVPLILFILSGLKPGMRAGLGALAALVLLGFCFFLFILKGVFLGPLGPVLAMLVAVVIREVSAFISSEQEKQFIRRAFSTYLSGDVVKEILDDPSRLQLGGAKKYMSAIFTDIRGFSTISEKLDPEDLVKLLNKYLSEMSNIVLEEKGTIDKYEGDAIIAFFGAPNSLPDHALRACRSAVKMKRKEAELNEYFLKQGLSPAPLLTRIGINTGDMVVGNMGTEQKMDYTIMGNAVNLTARLEGVNKQYGTWLLTTKETLKDTGGELLTRKLDRVRVVGIDEPVRLFEILELAENAGEDLKKSLLRFERALEDFEKRDWQKARKGFEAVLKELPQDGPAKIYLERCLKYEVRPPKADWDGVYNLNQK